MALRVEMIAARHLLERFAAMAAIGPPPACDSACRRRPLNHKSCSGLSAPFVTAGIAHGLVKLELIDARQKSSECTGHSWGRDSWLRHRSRLSLRSTGGATPLIFLAQLPPCLVVIGGLDFAGKTPATAIYQAQAAKRQKKRYLVECGAQLQGDVGFRGWLISGQAELLEVSGGDGKRDGITDGFVESVIRAIAEEKTAACCKAR